MAGEGSTSLHFIFAQTNRLLGEQPSGTYLEIGRDAVFRFLRWGSWKSWQ